MHERAPRTFHRALPALALVAIALGSGCRSSSGKPDEPPADVWLEPSPVFAQQIAEEARRLPWTHGIEHVQQIRWFASVGEAAYPTLLELAQDERDHVAAAALAALGATRDKRLVEHVRALPWSKARLENRDLAMERARTLVRLGDWSAIPVLVEGLLDERAHARVLCDQALYEATRLRFDYDPRGSEPDRAKAVRRWEEWWLARTGEGLLLTERNRTVGGSRS